MGPDKEIARKRYLSAKRGDLTSYAGMIGEEFSSKINRLSQIIGTSHELSVGEYKESLLRSCIEKFIPKKFSVGTGFIVFIGESPLSEKARDNIDLANLKEHSVSHQLDVVVFDDTDYAPIFRDRDFVVLRPESVKAIVEVKGFISDSAAKDAVEKFAKLGQKWKDYSDYCQRWGRIKLHNPSFYLMAWDVAIDTAGNRTCDGGSLRKTVRQTYHGILSQEYFRDRLIPVLHSAYIYDDCIVSFCSYANDKGQAGEGYSTHRGKFVRYDEEGKPFLDRDSTLSSLLASIHLALDTPFNPDFSYFDQSMFTSIFPHEHEGITDWLTGEEVNMTGSA